MKRIARAIISMGVVLTLASCSWEVPQTVSVKTNADYSFSLGTFEKELDNDMNLNSMMGNTGEGNQDIRTFDYFPGKLDKNTQHFLLEVKILDQQILTQTEAQALGGTGDSYTGPVNNLGTLNTDHFTGLDFNPATILSGMKEALGEDVSDKIRYSRVPLYLYCDTIDGLKAKAELKIFYGAKPLPASPSVPSTAEDLIAPTKDITRTPKPDYTFEENVVVTNLDNTEYTERKEIQTILNANNASDNSQLCISWKITELTATNIQKAAIGTEGIRIKIYAVIDLPLQFEVVDDLALDLGNMTKNSSESSSSNSSNNNENSGNEEFKKYLKAIDSVTIKYIAYKLPFYSDSGMMLGVDMVGNGNYERSRIRLVDENKKITDHDKSSIVLKQATIQNMKDISNFAPKVQVFMGKNTVFSVPREKAVKMNLEMNFKTDGTIQVK